MRGWEQVILAFPEVFTCLHPGSGVWSSMSGTGSEERLTGKHLLCSHNCAGSKPVCLRVLEDGVGMALLLPVSLRLRYLLGLLHIPQEARNKRQHVAENEQRCTSAFILFRKCQHDGSSVSLGKVVGTYLDGLCFWLY